eukprot:scaffold75580_cov60-Phaeocystis_antarctica.AAC.2
MFLQPLLALAHPREGGEATSARRPPLMHARTIESLVRRVWMGIVYFACVSRDLTTRLRLVRVCACRVELRLCAEPPNGCVAFSCSYPGRRLLRVRRTSPLQVWANVTDTKLADAECCTNWSVFPPQT